MPKHILIFSTAYYPFVGGAEVSVKEITDRLSSDFEFDLITVKMQKNLPAVEKIGAVTVYRVGFGIPLLDKVCVPFAGAIKVWRLHNKRNYFCMWGVMVTYATGAGYIFNILRTLVGKKKIPMVLTLQEGDSENHLKYRWGGLLALSWKLALWQTDFLTAISNFLLQRGIKNGYTGPSALVPNGVDVDVFTAEISEEVKEDMKKRFEKKDGDVFLITDGRLTHKNALDDVLSALVYLPKNIHFLVLGKGAEGQRLQAQAQNLGISNRVKFLGFIPYSELPKYQAISDIFIRPSRSEGFGNSFIQAMAAGLPVIATPVGGIVDFIDDKETGVFCSPDNPQSIVGAVNLILEDRALTQKIVRQARERVVSRYDWAHIAKEMKTRVFDKI